MPKEFEKPVGKKSVTDGTRRRRRRIVGSESGGSGTTPWSLGDSASSSTAVVTSQPQPSATSRSEALAAGALGAATLGSTVAVGVLSATTPTTLAGALTSAVTGSLGNVNVTTEAAVSAVTSAVTAAVPTTSGSTFSVDDFKSLVCAASGLTCLFFAVGFQCGIALCYTMDTQNNNNNIFNVLNLGFHYADSGYGSAASLDLLSLPSGGGSRESLTHSFGGDSLNLRGDGGEGPSGAVRVGGEGVGLEEVVVTQPTSCGGFPPLCLDDDSSSSGSSESLLGITGGSEGLQLVVVTQPGGGDSDSDRESVRQALLGAAGGDTNRGPGGKCKGKQKHLER